jgi:hypothetical protein
MKRAIKTLFKVPKKHHKKAILGAKKDHFRR